MGDVPALIGVSFAIGIVIGMTGMGGGALMTPALIFFGVPPSSAVANDLVAAAANKSVGAIVHWREGSPNLRLASWLITGSVPTAFAGAFIVDAFGAQEDQETFVKAAIGAALLIAAVTYVVRLYVTLVGQSRAGTPSETVHVRPLPTLALGAFGGLIVGVTSVGSGSVIMVVLLLLYPTLAPRTLVGTDLVQAIPLVASAAVSHVVVTGIDWSVLIPLVVGGSPGTFLGARMTSWVPQSAVRRGITLVLFLTGLLMLKVDPAVTFGVGACLLIFGPAAWDLAARRHRVPPSGADAGD